MDRVGPRRNELPMYFRGDKYSEASGQASVAGDMIVSRISARHSRESRWYRGLSSDYSSLTETSFLSGTFYFPPTEKTKFFKEEPL